MSAIPQSKLVTPTPVHTAELIYPLSVDQYHELIRSGKLGEDDPVELLEGILVFKMPKNTPHSTSTKLAVREFTSQLGPKWYYQSQEPITLSDGEPEPDGAVICGAIDDYSGHHPTPTDVALVIEVADSSLTRDRGIKLRSYARAKIPVYWIVNLIDRKVEVYTMPSAAEGEPTYLTERHYSPAETLTLKLSDGSDISLLAGTLLPATPGAE